jgi:hypothetical protein
VSSLPKIKTYWSQILKINESVWNKLGSPDKEQKASFYNAFLWTTAPMEIITQASLAIAQLNYGLYVVKYNSLPRSLEVICLHSNNMQEIRRQFLQYGNILL